MDNQIQRSVLSSALVLVALFACTFGHCQNGGMSTEPETAVNAVDIGPGDRISTALAQASGLIATSLSKDVYRLGAGDVLSVTVQGRANIDYKANPNAAEGVDPSMVTVAPTGEIYLPLLGSIRAAGKTVAQFEVEVKTGLSKYFKHFTANVSLSKPRVLYVWISGQVDKAGLIDLPAPATVSYAILRAGVQPTGSMRRAELIRNGEKKTVDLYRMLVLGDVESDIELQAGDTLHVPPVDTYATITGEVIRAGRYEMIGLSGGQESFCVRDLVELAIGVKPSAMLSKATIERIGPDGRKSSINLDLRDHSIIDTALQSGDTLVIPSISDYQPIIRFIGEFKGEGVYQRAIAVDQAQEKLAQIQNKSGIYYLKQGQTAGDVITATGGVTPQADLQRAYIERQEGGQARHVPLDLDRLLLKSDKTADVELINGDSLVLPALQDRVHIFGEVRAPGSFAYSPSRRLVDYIGDAGGPTDRSKLGEVRIARGSPESPEIITVNVKNTVRGRSSSNNPVLEAGDIVFVPSKVVGSWRDAVQMLITGLSLSNLLGGR